MIAIDTNVLLRYLLADHITQHTSAKAIILANRPVLITDVVLAETIWALTGKRYKLKKAAVCGLVRGLVGDSAFRFENSQVIWSALMAYQDSKPVRSKSLDFPNALIVHKLRVAESKGCKLEAFYSFHKAVGQLTSVQSPS